MISFLILPMQRVTRLPLLTDVSARPRPRAGRGPGVLLQAEHCSLLTDVSGAAPGRQGARGPSAGRALLPPDLLPPLRLCYVWL